MPLAQCERAQFIEQNLGLVHACAGRFRGRGIEYDDLYAAGCVGLVKAYDGFDETRGLRFSTYAVPVILGEIKKLFRDGGTVKVSRLAEGAGHQSDGRARKISEGAWIRAVRRRFGRAARRAARNRWPRPSAPRCRRLAHTGERARTARASSTSRRKDARRSWPTCSASKRRWPALQRRSGCSSYLRFFKKQNPERDGPCAGHYTGADLAPRAPPARQNGAQ